jgi:hypothetical protein
MDEAAVRADVTVLFTARTIDPPDQPTNSYVDAPAAPCPTTTVAASAATAASATGTRFFIFPRPKEVK